MTVDPLLDRIDAYCDAVPRTAARAEAHGPLTLFVNDGPGWPFYARPTRGTATVTPSGVDRVRARQRELGIPETFEWIAEVAPSLSPAASAAGLAVTDHPLLALEPGALRPVPTRRAWSCAWWNLTTTWPPSRRWPTSASPIRARQPAQWGPRR